MKIVRCNSNKPTPYLRKMLGEIGDICMVEKEGKELIYDIGCGNLRNTKFLHSQGYSNIVPIDIGGDYGACIDVVNEGIPAKNNSVLFILCNYLFCFLNKTECRRLAEEINRIAKKGAGLMIELYPAKTSGYNYTADQIIKLFPNWEIIHKNKYKFLGRKQ